MEVFSSKLFKSFVGATALVFSSYSSATIIEEVWQAKIYNVQGTTGYAVDDMISWTVTYDDQSTAFNRYFDGANGLDDDGLGDDTDFQKVCIDGGSDLNCTATVTDYTLLANATFDFGDIFSTMLSSSSIPNAFNAANYNQSILLTTTSAVTHLAYVSDSLSFMGVSDYHAGYFLSQRYDDDPSIRSHDRIEFSQVQISSSVSQVPEPSIIALFAAGLFGIGFARRRKA